jgi:K+-transporting ATPase ATPase C chain
MLGHLRANLWLLGLTVLVCCVLYPLALWCVAQAPPLREKAQGSLVLDEKGNAVGSHLIAQGFTQDRWFWPRPSSAGKGYDASASGASNWGASNPALRQRVLGQLGAILNYGPKGARPGWPIGPDIEKWFQGKPGIVGKWAGDNADDAKAWAKDLNGKYVEAWMKEHPAEVEKWVKENPAARSARSTEEPGAEDLAVRFFEWYSEHHPGTWPVIEADEIEDPEKSGEKLQQPRLTHVKTGQEIRRNFYPMWREEHPDEDLEPVPSDAVMASGSGLDPHITLANAIYQTPRVAATWTEELVKEGKVSGDHARRAESETRIRDGILNMLKAHAAPPVLGGPVGVPLVNVLEVNLALPEAVAEALR